MSKLVPDQSVIHLMESNVAGNKQGEMASVVMSVLQHSPINHEYVTILIDQAQMNHPVKQPINIITIPIHFQLLQDLVSGILAHRVKVESPLELAHAG